MRYWRAGLILVWAIDLSGQTLADFRTPLPLPQNATLVVGFLGGIERWNDPQRGVRKVALRLREIPGVYAETAANRRRHTAMKFIRRAVAGRPDVRLILYGQSLGGSAAVRSARELERSGVQVALTVQVDSVGLDDAVIPPNVAAAVNFYQHDRLTIVGRSEIRAADPERTKILGNFEATYLGRSVGTGDEPWFRRTIGGGHTKMELDPEVWARVEQYIQEAIGR